MTHVRWLHTSGLGQQLEALVVEPEPEPFSVFRTQQNDPVSRATSPLLISMCVSDVEKHLLCVDLHDFDSVIFLAPVRLVSQRSILDSFTPYRLQTSGPSSLMASPDDISSRLVL